MKKIYIIFALLFITITSIFAQVPQQEQILLDNLAAARSNTDLEGFEYQQGIYRALSSLFTYYWTNGNYTKVEEIVIEQLSIMETYNGRDSEGYAQNLSNLGQLYMNIGQYEKAKNTYAAANDIYERLDVINNPMWYIQSQGGTGIVLMMQGNYQDAEKYLLHASVLCDKYRLDGRQKGIWMGMLGTTYTAMGQYNKAEKYLLEAKSRMPENDPNCGKALNNIGLLYFRMGQYDKSMNYFIQAYDIKKQTLPENHPLHASSLSNIALVSTFAGEYEEAEKCYLQALAIQETKKIDNFREYANTLINLAHLYNQIGDYERAIQYIQQGLQILGNLLGENHLDYATSLCTRAMIELAKGDYSAAIQTALNALSIQSKIDEKHPEIVTTMMVLGKAYLMNKDYIHAESALQDALVKAKILLGEHHDNYAEILYLLGLLYDKVNNTAQSENYFQQSLTAFENLYSTQHPKYIATLNSLGELYQKNQQYNKAKSCFQQVAQVTKDIFVSTTNYMSERQRGLFWETIRHRYETIYPTFTYESVATDSTIAGFAYNNELFMKGLLLHSSATIHNSIMNSGDSILIQQWEKLKLMNVQILALQENDPTSSYLEELKNDAEELEKQLTTSSMIFRNNRDVWNTTWDSIRNSLQPNQVAIEFFVVPNKSQGNVYCALLLHANSLQPLFIPLCSEDELTTFVTQAPSQTYDYSQYGQHLYNLIWAPILVHVKKGYTISFSPSGCLHQLAIEYLPCDSKSTMQDVYQMERLSSTREIVKDMTSTTYSNAVLYGGIQYDMDGEELLAESEIYQNQQFVSRAVEVSTDRAGVQYLPGTKKEVDYINRLLTTNHIQSRLYTGAQGNEESFKSLDGCTNHILHIATHGFFWSDENAKSTEYYMQRLLTSAQKALPIDPLSRCGLLFAGANLSLLGHTDELPQGVQDGILTAKEISLLDLSHTQIAILSACETGRGEVTAEGVFGLQRALKQAGVQTIVMSLWPVNDSATQLLMQHFYTNWIKRDMNKREAFRLAQKSVKMKYQASEYWAGFILLD